MFPFYRSNGGIPPKTDMQTRQKATSATHPGLGPASIPEAYRELSQEAFAVWMRLHVADDDELEAGRGKIAKMLGYSERRANEILRDLQMAGYLDVEVRPGHTTRFAIKRRAQISARGRFFRLSSLASHGVLFTEPDPAFLASTGTRSKFIPGGTYGEAPSPAPRASSMAAAMVADKARQKDARAELRSTARANIKRSFVVQGRVPGTIDWMELDKYDDPVLSFDPSHHKYPLFLAILDRPTQDKHRKILVAKIETEFCRIYTRYRRDAERRRTSTSNYTVSKGERKYAQEAGILCLQKGVTPRRLLEYWDQNIQHFANGDMLLPPISFLKSAANIDRVAVSNFGAEVKGHRQRSRTAPPERAAKPVGGNSYSDPGRLHPKLRSALEAGGFDTQSYNDRFLLTVQHNAMLIAQGKAVYMAPGVVKSMAEHAAAGLYAND